MFDLADTRFNRIVHGALMPPTTVARGRITITRQSFFRKKGGLILSWHNRFGGQTAISFTGFDMPLRFDSQGGLPISGVPP